MAFQRYLPEWVLKEEEPVYNLRKHMHPQMKDFSLECFPSEGQLRLITSGDLALIVANFDRFKSTQLQATRCLITGQFYGRKVEEVLIVTLRDPESIRKLARKRSDFEVEKDVSTRSMDTGNAVVIETTKSGESRKTKVFISPENSRPHAGLWTSFDLPDGGKI